MDNTQTSKDSSQKLNAKIKATWSKLDDTTIALLATNQSEFYKAVQAKQGVDEATAKATVKKLEAECAAACSASGDKKAAPATSAPIAKAS